LYPAATSIFLAAHDVMPNNVLLALNLAQSLLKGWPSNEAFARKGQVAKHCINVIEAEKLDELSSKRYNAIKAPLKEL